MKLRTDVWWWGVIIPLRGIAVNLPFIFFYEGAAQMCWVIMTLMVYSRGLIAFFPWRFPAASICELGTCGSLLMVAAWSVWFAYKTPRLDDQIATVGVIVSFSPVILAIFCTSETPVGIL